MTFFSILNIIYAGVGSLPKNVQAEQVSRTSKAIKRAVTADSKDLIWFTVPTGNRPKLRMPLTLHGNCILYTPLEMLIIKELIILKGHFDM